MQIPSPPAETECRTWSSLERSVRPQHRPITRKKPLALCVGRLRILPGAGSVVKVLTDGGASCFRVEVWWWLRLSTPLIAFIILIITINADADILRSDQKCQETSKSGSALAGPRSERANVDGRMRRWSAVMVKHVTSIGCTLTEKVTVRIVRGFNLEMNFCFRSCCSRLFLFIQTINFPTLQ